MANMVAIGATIWAVFLLPVTAVKVELLKPTNTNGTLDVAIIITPGAEIDGLAYKPLGETIQKLFPGRLWVALLHDFIFNTPNPLSLESGFKQAVSDLKDAGFKGNNVYLAGHSLGGVFVSSFGQSHGSELKGVLLFAAYLTRGNRLRDYPVPLLTLSGDLDGLTRLTRIVDTFEELENETVHNHSPMSLMYTRPVIVMRGLNHGHFASGKMPPNVLSHDIDVDDDVTFNSAHTTIAWHVIDFIIVNLRQPSEDFLTCVAAMKVAFYTTRDIIQPLSMIKAMDTNSQQSSMTTAEEQLLLLGKNLSRHTKTNDTEISEHNVAFYEPEVKMIGTSAHVQTYTSVIMPFNPEDVSESPQTPSELQAIMKSKFGMHAILKNITMDGTNLTCKDLNMHAMAIAYNASSDVAKSRAVKRNAPKMTFQNDVPLSSVVEWIGYSLNLKYGANGAMDVTSYSHMTSIRDDPMDKSSGILYCKLLSPYRAMEWFYLDSLKRAKPSLFG